MLALKKLRRYIKLLTRTQNKKEIIDSFDLNDFNQVQVNPQFESIKKDIILNKEGLEGLNGALMVDTGEFTGRSPDDKYFVSEDYSNDFLWWGPVNQKVDFSIFKILYNKVI